MYRKRKESMDNCSWNPFGTIKMLLLGFIIRLYRLMLVIIHINYLLNISFWWKIGTTGWFAGQHWYHSCPTSSTYCYDIIYNLEPWLEYGFMVLLGTCFLILTESVIKAWTTCDNMTMPTLDGRNVPQNYVSCSVNTNTKNTHYGINYNASNLHLCIVYRTRFEYHHHTTDEWMLAIPIALLQTTTMP